MGCSYLIIKKITERTDAESTEDTVTALSLMRGLRTGRCSAEQHHQSALRSTAFSAARQPASFESAHRVQRIVQSFETGKTLEIITSNHQPDLPQPSTAPVPERHCCQRPSRLRGNRAGGAVMVGGATAVGGARRWEGQC